MKSLSNILVQIKEGASFSACREIDRLMKLSILSSITSFSIYLFYPIYLFMHISYGTLLIATLLLISKSYAYPKTCYHFAFSMEKSISKFFFLFAPIILCINILFSYLSHASFPKVLIANIFPALPIILLYTFSKYLRKKYEWQGKAYQLFGMLPLGGQVFFLRKVLTGLGFYIEDSNCKVRSLKIPISLAPRISIKVSNPLFWVSFRRGGQRIFIAELKLFPSRMEIHLAVQILKKLAEEGLVFLIAPTLFLSEKSERVIEEILTINKVKLIDNKLTGLVPTFYTEILSLILSNKEVKPVIENLIENGRKKWNGLS